MQIIVKKRSAGQSHLYIYINVHSGGDEPLKRVTLPKTKIKKSSWNKQANRQKKNWVSTKEYDYKSINQLIYATLVNIESQFLGEHQHK